MSQSASSVILPASSLEMISHTAHGLVSGDVGKPIGKRAADAVAVWDDAAGTQTEYPIGVLQRVLNANLFLLARPGAMIDLPAALITVAGTEPASNGRFLYWDRSVGEYVVDVPGDAVIQVECVYYWTKNGDGSHKVIVLGMRPVV